VTKLTNNTDANLKGTMSESNRCADCGFDTAPGLPNRAEVEQAATAQIAAGIKNWSIPCEVNDRSELSGKPLAWSRGTAVSASAVSKSVSDVG
jgi:hypothetical protein